MTEPLLATDEAIAAAVRIIDEGIDYGAIGIDAPAEVGRRAMEILAPAVERSPDDLRLRCVYSAAISLSGRLSDAREQLGMILTRDAAYFEAVAELDHPSAWRHVVLSPPWSGRSTRLVPLARRWLHPGGQLRFVSLREGADRIVALLGLAPADVAADPGLPALPAALDLNLLTRSAGAFLAMHFGLGGPDPERVRTFDGFEFPWPEGTGFRSELLMRFFLQQDRTYVILTRPEGSVVLNRLMRFGPDDRERHDRFLRRLEAASPRDTDTRLQQTTIGRYFEEFDRDALRARLAYRLRQGHAPPEPLAAEEVETPPQGAPAPGDGRIQTVPMVTPAVTDDAPAPTDQAAARSPSLASASPLEPALESEQVSDEEIAARSALAVAGLWPWARRERLLGYGIPLLLVVVTAGGAATLGTLGVVTAARIVAGALLGLALGILLGGLLASRHEVSLRRHVERLLTTAEGSLTIDSLAEAARDRAPEVLPGVWGARLVRRFLRLLEAPRGPAA